MNRYWPYGDARRGPAEQSPEVERRLFRPISAHSIKVACVVCGSTGLPGGRWQRTHRRGHAPCLDCGQQLTVKMDHQPRKHARCPGRPT